jgi:hypothetical protein
MTKADVRRNKTIEEQPYYTKIMGRNLFPRGTAYYYAVSKP